MHFLFTCGHKTYASLTLILVAVVRTGRLSVLACCSREDLFQATAASADVCLSQVEPFVWRIPGACSVLLITTLRWRTDLFLMFRFFFQRHHFWLCIATVYVSSFFQRIPHIYMISIRLPSVKIRHLLRLVWRQFSSRSA